MGQGCKQTVGKGGRESSSRLGHRLKEAWTRPTLSTVEGESPGPDLTENTVKTEEFWNVASATEKWNFIF